MVGSSPPLRGGIAFFLLNVLLGVVGTFWYRTQQRSAEIGLRMAMGATRKGIFWQLVKEGLALLTIAFIPSAAIFANLLYMEVTQGSEIPPDMASRLLFGFVFSYAVMAAMIVVGISFPSYRAMRMHPADAFGRNDRTRTARMARASVSGNEPTVRK